MSVPTEMPDELADTTPATKLIWTAIATVEEEEPVTATELKDCLDLSPGTVYPALEELEEMGLIESRPDIESPRRSLYYR